MHKSSLDIQTFSFNPKARKVGKLDFGIIVWVSCVSVLTYDSCFSSHLVTFVIHPFSKLKTLVSRLGQTHISTLFR